MPLTALRRMDTSSGATSGRANISSSWYSSFAPYCLATVCGIGSENTLVAPYVASGAVSGNGTQKSVSPRMNLASAVWMPVCGAAFRFRPVLCAISESSASTMPVIFPSPS